MGPFRPALWQVLPWTSTVVGRAAALAFEASEQTVDRAPVQSTTSALSGHQGTIVRRRVRQAVNNDPTVSHGIQDLRDGLRGPMEMHSTNPATMARIQNWRRKVGWGLQFGTLGQVWARVCHELVTNGECYLQRIQVTPADPTQNGLRLQVWSMESVDQHANGSIDGHALTDQGEYAGTFFRGPLPTESSRFVFGTQSLFVPDSDLIAIRLCYEATAIRGYPIAAPALKAARILDSLAMAEMQQAQLDANIVAIGLVEQSPIFGKNITGAANTFTDVHGNTVEEIDPGTLMLGRGISDVKTLSRDARVVNYDAAQARVAAGLRSTTERIGGQLNKASFSALRGASDQRRRTVNSLDRDSGLTEGRRELAHWFVESEALAGSVVDEATLSWLQDPRETANDLQTLQSMALERSLGWLDDDTAIRMRGRDPAKVRKSNEQNIQGTDTAPRLQLLMGGKA